ncbi:ParB/RepB/Spo0J family partition protein [Sulfuritalea sp.]|uniref:ParB/RepB/Spo0J family partition protein n=1 Tax=Sulfuritalea sp. TaxID=2480090 RepID=UPI00286E697B|nr:ParB/RepB/Spo0J family partition protein [Sulfuritalea sp.]
MTTTPKTAKAAAPKNPAKVSLAKTKAAAPELPTISSVKLVPLALIDIAPQVRTVFDEDSIRELADDILTRGLLQPVLLNPHGARFTLIAGERRLRACRLAELSDIPALVTKASAADALLIQLAENIQREDLELQDQVNTIRLLHDNLKSVAAVAETVKKSAGWVSKRLALSHPDLHWMASNLMQDGVTEDVEILNCLSSIAELSYSKGNELTQQIREGKATRETARQVLKALKTEAKAKPGPILSDADREQTRQAQEERMATLAAERIAKDKEANEGHGPRFIERALRQLQTLCAEPSEDAPNAADEFLNTLNTEQHTALLDHLQQHQESAQRWTFEEWARALHPWNDGPSYLEHFVALMAIKGQKFDNLYALVTILQSANREGEQ